MSKTEQFCATLIFGTLLFITVVFSVGFNPLIVCLIGNTLAGMSAFVLITSPNRFYHWNIGKTATAACFLILGFVSLGAIAFQKVTKKLF
jgi:hypothetical protein